MAVELIIKSATQSVEDFVLSCEMTWTVGQVKEQLSEVYPLKPKKEHQKLIYGGKLLLDNLILETVLNHTQDVHTVHLVCPGSYTPKPKPSNEIKEKPVPPVYTVSPSNPSAVFPQMNPQTIVPGFNSLPGASWPVTSIPDPTQQYLVMQQMYMQMMSQYFSQFNASNPYGALPANTPSVQPPQAPTTTRPNAQQIERMRQQREDEDRDYLDYLYLFSRVAILAGILLYYSSPMRVVAVLFVVVSVSLIDKFIQKQRRNALRREAERLRNAAAQASTNHQAPENEQIAETTAGSESVSTEPQNPNQPATSVPYTIFTLVTAFFSSLIPTDPYQPIVYE